MTTTPPPKSPTVAIARILRDHLGLTQGRGGDFRVRGEYNSAGERLYTYVVTYTREVDELIATHADDIERWSKDGPFPFRVSVTYVGDNPRPWTEIANGGKRVRHTPPAPTGAPSPAEPTPVEPTPVEPAAVEPAAVEPAAVEPAAVEPAAVEPAAVEPEAPAAPSPARVLDALTRSRERAQKKRAFALAWSAGQAELMAMAAAAQLSIDPDGVLRHRAQPGQAGRRVTRERLHPLINAGLIIVADPDPDGAARVQVTADGRAALALWRRWQPPPLTKNRKEELQRLPVLLGGQYAAWIHRKRQEEDQRQKLERDEFNRALAAQHAWEDREKPLRAAWAAVNRVLNWTVPRPAGWVPTPEEAAAHDLDPAVVAALHADAECPQLRPVVPRLRPCRMLELPRFEADATEPEQMALFGAVGA
ncbi:hypothetical protein [Embleya sp. NPDC001921]